MRCENILVAQLGHCRVYRTSYGVMTLFEDDSNTSNWPPGTHEFNKTASDCGFDDPVAYVVDHDLSHAFLAEKMWDATSPVLWSAAHQNHIEETASLFEERWVYHWQRYARGLIEPLEPEWIGWLPEYQTMQRNCDRVM